MSKEKKEEVNLDDIYPDLSDFEEEEQPPIQKNPDADLPRAVPAKRFKNPQQGSSVLKTPQIIVPSFLGGGTFKPPPPPPGRGQNKPVHPDEAQFKSAPHTFTHRDRKNHVFVKNIPKAMNKNEKLVTFFRTYGNVKNVKVNDENNSAWIRFEREQDALKFVNSKAHIFNRSYILYSLEENFQVSPQLVIEREKQETSANKTVEKQLIILREAAQTTIADKYRCLLFLRKQSLDENQQMEIQREMAKCIKFKESKIDDEEMNNMLADIENEYDWTLTYRIKTTASSIEKKKIILQFNKYGPIGTIQIRLTVLGQQGLQGKSEEQEKLAIIKLKFLGVKSSWKMYSENSQKMGLEVEGKKLEEIFITWQRKIEQSGTQVQKEGTENLQMPAKEE